MINVARYTIVDTPDIFAIKDRKLTIVTCNATFLKYVGKKIMEDVCGLDDFNLPWSDYAEMYHKHDSDALSGKIYKQIVPVIDWKKNFSVIINDKRPIYDENNEIIGVISKAKNITGTVYQEIAENCIKLLPSECSRSITIKEKETFVKLSKRQKQCLLLMVKGKTNTEIANILELQKRTVEHYIEDLKNKLGCTKRGEIIEESIKKGYINIVPSNMFLDYFNLLKA